nr:MAG TPA: hypothetical protein [Caudoviricetes sp.]DAY29623.1 MAG TPA: hypothetical protein [Caudoviricetes sp.]
MPLLSSEQIIIRLLLSLKLFAQCLIALKNTLKGVLFLLPDGGKRKKGGSLQWKITKQLNQQ